MKLAKLAYPMLAMGVFILTLSPILGASLSAKLAESYGLHKTNKITATALSNSKQSGESTFSLESMRQLAQYDLRNYDLAYALEASTLAVYKESQSQVQVLGVNDRYHQFHQITLKAGSFLTLGQENQRVAVIDETLAQTLFQNYNVLGLDIEIYSQKFTIIGVAEDDRSLVGNLTDSDYGTVYIPVKKLLELEGNSGITSIEAETRDSGTTGRNTASLKTALTAIGKDPADYRVIDYNLERLLLDQKNLLRDFVVGMGAIVVLFGLLRRKVWSINRFCRLRLQENYFLEIIRVDSTKLLLGMAKLLVIVAAMLLVWRLIKFPFYISPENIPNELIDLSFFADLLKKGIQAGVQSNGYLTSPGEAQLNIIKALQNWNIALSLFLGLPLFYLGLYLGKELGGESLKVEVFCSACLMVALLIGIALLLMTKMPLEIGTGGVILVFLSILLRKRDTPVEV